MAMALEALVARLIKAGYPKDTAKKIASGELPMSDTSRFARAGEQATDTSRELFHWTNRDFTEFQPSTGGKFGQGVYLSPRPYYGEKYVERGDPRRMSVFGPSNIAKREDINSVEKSVLAEMKEQNVPPMAMGDTFWNMVQGKLKEKGFDALEFGDEVVVFDPARVRDVRAAFDPANVGKPNILGGASPVAAGGVLAALTGNNVEASTAGMNAIMSRRLNPEPVRIPEEFWTQSNGIGVAQAPAQNPVSQGAEYVAGKLHAGGRALDNAGILSLLGAPLQSLGDIASRAAYGESKVTDPAEALLSASAFAPQLYFGGKTLSAMRDKDVQSMLFRRLFGE